MNAQFLMAFEHYKIMSVAFMIAEEQILAMSRVNILPILKSEFDGWKRGVMMSMEFDSMFT